MSENSHRRARRQLLGKRVGVDPYYTIAETTPTYLELRSRPEVNTRPARTLMGVGGGLVVLATTIFCISIMIGGQSAGTWSFLVGAVFSWPCALVGGIALIGGMALSRTVNTLIVDPKERTITYIQKAKRERQQILDFDQIAHLRIRKQRVNTAFIIQRVQVVAVLEFVTNDNFPWVIDSAADPESIEPVASAIAEIMQVEVKRSDTEEPEDLEEAEPEKAEA